MTNRIALEIIFIITLILANGAFSLSEIALVSSRPTRLRKKIEEGHRGAARALALAQQPAEFLSTVQIGITLIGILTGVFGGATITEQLAARLDRLPAIAPHGEAVAVTIVVIVVTYFSVVIGELVPKHIALARPESVASLVAPATHRIARLATPFVRILTGSTEIVLRLLRVPRVQESATAEELTALVHAGAKSGVFHPIEAEMVRGVLTLGDRNASMVMTRRQDIVWLNLNDGEEVGRRTIATSGFSRFPVGEGSLDQFVGVIDVKDVVRALITGHALDLRGWARQPTIVYEQTPAADVLRQLQETGSKVAMVIDEYGGIEGLITRSDVMATVLGEREPAVVRRADGSLLINGLMKFDTFSELVRLPGISDRDFETVAGFAVARLGRIPAEGEAFEVGPWRFEVLDMDDHRIDKMLLTRKTDQEE